MERFEITLQSAATYASAAQEATLTATFFSPLGETTWCAGFGTADAIGRFDSRPTPWEVDVSDHLLDLENKD